MAHQSGQKARTSQGRKKSEFSQEMRTGPLQIATLSYWTSIERSLVIILPLNVVDCIVGYVVCALIVCMSLCVRVCARVYMCACVYMYVRIHVCVCTCVHVCVLVCVCTKRGGKEKPC